MFCFKVGIFFQLVSTSSVYLVASLIYKLNYVFSVQNVRHDDEDSMSVINVKRRQYYLLPCFYLIYGSKRLLSLVLNVMGSWVSEASSSVDRSNTICTIASVLLLMYEDVKVRQILPSCKIEMASVLQNMLNLLVRMLLHLQFNFITFFSNPKP